jgi:hypothetical protein
MTKEKYFDKLEPANQLAIEEQVKRAKKEELEEIYRERKSKEACDKQPKTIGEYIIMALVILLLFVMIIVPWVQNIIYTESIYRLAPVTCKGLNQTLIDVKMNYFTPQIICSGNTINLP